MGMTQQDSRAVFKTSIVKSTTMSSWNQVKTKYLGSQGQVKIDSKWKSVKTETEKDQILYKPKTLL